MSSLSIDGVAKLPYSVASTYSLIIINELVKANHLGRKLELFHCDCHDWYIILVYFDDFYPR